ncbi:Ribosomal RNA small subunit methyltransferase D [Nymphon striatum]|nr:Ribosomal RNA small subunit methyltransferase D [Nymphon striatum]
MHLLRRLKSLMINALKPTGAVSGFSGTKLLGEAAEEEARRNAKKAGKKYEKPADTRERIRDGWSTSAPSEGGKKSGFDKPKREARPNRSSNVWMAPGARPQGTKKDADGEASADYKSKRSKDGIKSRGMYGAKNEGGERRSTKMFGKPGGGKPSKSSSDRASNWKAGPSSKSASQKQPAHHAARKIDVKQCALSAEKFRGRAIAAPKPGSNDIRPTTDRARESLFNILQNAHGEKLSATRVLDLFAGTGALGFEAMSRGAEFVLFVEMGTQGRGLIRETTHALGLQGTSKLFRRDATALGEIGSMEPFDLVFADPPYGKRLGEAALESLRNGGWLKPDSLIVLEEAADAIFSMPEGFKLLDERRSKTSVVRLIMQAKEQ